ncbi:MAG: hypothetical protein RL189_2060 [Pseudomonadota bacterium]
MSDFLRRKGLRWTNSGEFVRPASLTALILLLTIAIIPTQALADEYEVLKQRRCTILVTPSAGLVVGQSVQAETNDGRRFSFRVSKKSRRNATIVLRGSRCPKISGGFSTGGSSGRGGKKFYLGVIGGGGLFTFKQPFTPEGEIAQDGTVGDPPQPINGLSGGGFSGGAMMRFAPSQVFGLDLGVAFLSANTSGKTVLSNQDDYLVNAKFSEVVILPALSVMRCISKRLYCKAGGVFAIPVGSKISIKSSSLSVDSALKYNRIGGEFAAGLNLGSAFTLTGGAQVSMIKGSFLIPEQSEPVKLQNPLTVFVFGGIVVAL